MRWWTMRIVRCLREAAVASENCYKKFSTETHSRCALSMSVIVRPGQSGLYDKRVSPVPVEVWPQFAQQPTATVEFAQQNMQAFRFVPANLMEAANTITGKRQIVRPAILTIRRQEFLMHRVCPRCRTHRMSMEVNREIITKFFCNAKSFFRCRVVS